MKPTLALGFSAIIIASACAPVASSVPKIAANSPKTKDSVVVESVAGRKAAFGIEKRAKVVSADKYESFEKKLDSDYRLARFDEKDAKVSELRELHAMGELDLATAQSRTEVLVIFVVKGGEKAISEETAESLKLDFPQRTKSDFSFAISLDGDSGASWSTIKANLVSVTIAYREAKAKN